MDIQRYVTERSGAASAYNAQKELTVLKMGNHVTRALPGKKALTAGTALSD
ncbi:MAG: hypothetical protein ACREBD_29780 [Blastocatellia bacterium]